MHESASPPTPQAPEPRIPFSPAYLCTVVVMVALNMAIFVLLGRRMAGLFQIQAEPTTIETMVLVMAFFVGLLFATACNLTALSLAKGLRRQSVSDRILLFLLVEIAGITILALVLSVMVSSIADLQTGAAHEAGRPNVTAEDSSQRQATTRSGAAPASSSSRVTG